MSQAVAIVATPLTCYIVVLAGEPAIIWLLRRAAVIDIPNGRSSHSVPTPRGGGAPIATALAITSFVAFGLSALPFALAVAAFGIIGLADDLTGLRSSTRLELQAGISCALAVLLLWPAIGSGPLGAAEMSLPWPALAVIAAAAGPVLIIWITGFVNAFNFMDGINGISAGHAIVAGGAYAFLGVLDHDSFITGAGAAIAACGLAFLPWNAFRARVFLGDVGSYALGAGLAVLAVDAVAHGVTLEAAVAPLALYLADTFWTLQRRIRAGEPWREAHRTHAYQRLCDAGWSHQQVTVAACAGSAVISVLGVASMTGTPGYRIGGDLLALAVLALYLAAPALAKGELRRTETA